MKKLKFPLTLLATLALTSCAATKLLPASPPPLQSDLKHPCKDPVPLTDSSMGGLASALLQNTAALRDCKSKDDKIIASWPK